MQNTSLETKEVEVEISGTNIEKELSKIKNVKEITRISNSGKQEKFRIRYHGEDDIRPIFFAQCKNQNWTVGERPQLVPRLQDMFYSLTSEQNNLE